MTGKTGKLVIIGGGETAGIAYEYFTEDSPYEVVAFSVERPFLKEPTAHGLPVVAFDELETHYPPTEYHAFVAISYVQLNRVRARLYQATKAKGYRLVSYVSSRAFVWKNVSIGENTFVFENNVVQYHAKIGNDVILWSGNHIGHQSVIHDHAYLSSHVVVSGFCEIGESCFLGVNACLGDHVTVGRDCLIGMGAVVVRNTEPGKVYVGNPAKPMQQDAFAAFEVERDPAP
jgi:sugar O-acyltransferase (sialic acid O-acetyltransferase NeuD family)